MLSGNGVLAHYQGEYDRAEVLCQEALQLSRTLDDRTGIAEALTGLGLVRRARGDYPEAETLFREALAGYESLDDEAGVARGIDRLAMHFVVVGDDAKARPLFEDSLTRFRRLGDAHGIALGLYGLGYTRPAGALVDARMQVDESLDILRTVGDRRTFGKVLWCLAGINADLGDVETAAAQLEESLTLFIEFGDRWFCVLVLESVAFLASSSHEVERAVRLLGAADTVLENIGVPLLARFRARHDRILTDARTTLDDARFATAWNEGKRLSLEGTVELVRAAGAPADLDTRDGLTAREIEVLVLVADGRTDAEVAEKLVVSVRTVHAHLRSIYRKLDLHTRSAATRYALEHGL